MKRLQRYLLLLAFVVPVWMSSSAFASCSSPKNSIEAENCLPGSTGWQIGSGSGDPTIQGFATDISVNVGQTVFFKIRTSATAYHVDIYRMGYYQGDGGRYITTIQPSATLPQTQPACITNSTTRLYDCGNWGVSASWAVPATAVSGIYIAAPVRNDTGGASQIFFIVRNDAGHSDILFQTSDEAWHAYNPYGGHSLYGDTGFNLQNRAYKVSYNRPFNTANLETATWIFNAEYPMVRWLEANAYDVSYFTSVDAARNGSLITNHKVYLSVGHDEYWSAPKRASVEAARAAGVNLAFFSGNEGFWKTRWENSVDGSNTPYRTLVCYKETLGPNSTPSATAAVDPLDPPTWTGTWRDPTKSPPADGGRPENALNGTIFAVNGPGTDNTNLSIKVPAADGKMRFWRNTAIAAQSPGQTWTLPAGTLGYEWDIDSDNGFRPSGLFDMSTATFTLTSDLLLDYGGLYGAGTATHHLTLYRYYNNVGESSQTPLGLVFGAGTVQWSWGLDANHDNSGTPTDPNMQQATVNLFADMGAQPATLQAGLLLASQSTDAIAPVSLVNSPVNGSQVSVGTTINITGTASDSGGGVVAGVEVSVNGGTTWHPASGRGTWTYKWKPGASGTAVLRSRAVDDSGNLETPSAGVSVTVTGRQCPCSIWGTGAAPGTTDSGDPGSVELGVRFRADVSGFITGIRFYKAGTNTGTHIGNLWSNSGALLARATFAGESASGWQQVNFASPVAITANTTYVASYFDPRGHYSVDSPFFAAGGVDNQPLHALADGVDGGNGTYIYSSTSAFPNSTFQSSNYWVDVVFNTSSGPHAISSLALNPATVIGGTSSTGIVTLNAQAPTGGAVVTLVSSNTAAATVAASVTVPAGSTSTTFTVTTLGVAANTSSVITATYGVAKAATLTVNAAALSSVTRTPTSVVGGNNSTGTVTLNGAAPPAGAVVALSSSNTAAAQVPASVTIAGGARSTTFTITTSVVASQTTSTITASYAGVKRTTTLTVNPAALSSVTRTPSSVVGGNNSTGTVTLNGAAPASGAVITLTSSNTVAARVPANVTIAGGARSATFTITTSGVASQTTSTITASHAGVSRTTTLTVNVASLSSLTLTPSTVTGGTSATATLTLNGAAPPSGAVVTTASSNTNAAHVPVQVTIPSGSKSIKFTVTTSPVTASTTSQISGTYRGTTRNATLTVQ
jgi:hypothetical protein